MTELNVKRKKITIDRGREREIIQFYFSSYDLGVSLLAVNASMKSDEMASEEDVKERRNCRINGKWPLGAISEFSFKDIFICST
jgi:hypothetical protein